jgi:hypothetical protein
MTVMFAICHPQSSQVKQLEDRILYGDEGALVFQTEGDARSHIERRMDGLHDNFVVEPIAVQLALSLVKHEYRVMLRRLSISPSEEVREQMLRILPDDYRTEFFRFRSNPEGLGAMVRSILWAEGIPFPVVATTVHPDGHVIVRVQRRKPDTRDRLAKLLNPSPVPEYEDIGTWDCGGIEYSIGR